MTANTQVTADLAAIGPTSSIDIGRPVEWMVDPENPDILLGVTYVFSQSGLLKTVWYTPNKRRPKAGTFVTVPVPK